MDRLLTIFISSAIGEFLAERKALKAALERWQFVRAWTFEEETAYAEPLVSGYLRRDAESDIVILLIGDQPSRPVEDEFVTALNARRPILAFVKRSARKRAEALFAAHRAADRFKYAVFDGADLEAKVIEAVQDEILIGYRRWQNQAQQLVKTFPRLTPSEGQELDRAYLAEVIQKYEFWRTHYTPLAAIARLRPEWAGVKTAPTATPVEFLPRGFDVLLREKLTREEPHAEHAEPKTEHYDDLREAIEKHGDLILLGEPGAGKTTTLRRLMFDYAQRASTGGSQTRPYQLLILISLGRYDGTSNILDFLRAELLLASKGDSAQQVYPAHRRLAAHLDEYLEDGRLAIFFDALNEMPLTGYADSIRRLVKFCGTQSGNRFIFTCRALDYTVKLDLLEATIQDLNEEAQRDFLAAYFGADGERLFETLRENHQDLLEVGRNPYMLLMIGQVYQVQGELPPNRGLLFQSFVHALMERERQTHPQRWLDAELQVHVLSDLAFAIQREHGRGTSAPRDWVNQHLTGRVRVDGREVAYEPTELPYLARSASLLDESADGSVRFTHQLLQEYFAAVALRSMGVDSDELREAARYPQWNEVMVLLTGLMENATPLVKLLITVDPYLAARCTGAAHSVSSSIVNTLTMRMMEKLNSRFRAECMAAVQALGTLKAEISIPYLVQLLRDKYLRDVVIQALGRFKSEAVIPYILQPLKDKDPHVRADAVRVLGELASDAVISYLIQMLKDGELEVVRAVEHALGRFKVDAIIPYLAPLLTDREKYVRLRAMWLLINLKSKAVTPYLIALLKDDDPDMRNEAAQALGELKDESALLYLVPLLKDEYSYVGYAATVALGKLGSDSVISHLVEAVENRDIGTREAGEALSKLNTELVVQYIIPLLRAKDRITRLQAVQVLGVIKTREIASCLFPLLKDDEVGWATAQTLSEFAPDVVISDLVPLLNSKDSLVREKAEWILHKVRSQPDIPYASGLKDKYAGMRRITVQQLGELKDYRVIPHLLPMLRDEDWDVHETTVLALWKLKAEESIPYLIPLLRDENSEVREMAVRTLGELKAREAITHLLPLLEDKHPNVRGATALSLGKLGAQEAIPSLIFLLKDKDGWVRWTAVVALGELKAETATSYLFSFLKDNDPFTRETAAQTLARLGGASVIPHLLPLLRDKEKEDDIFLSVHQSVTQELKLVAREEHLPLFILLLSDDDPDVYNAAFEIIEAVKRRLNLPKDYPLSAEINTI